jgi:hypothetical protein
MDLHQIFTWKTEIVRKSCHRGPWASFRGTHCGSEDDGQLLKTLEVVVKLHERFYDNDGRVVVPLLLKDMREEVLSGVKAVFSGLVPLQVQNNTRGSTRGRRKELVR